MHHKLWQVIEAGAGGMGLQWIFSAFVSSMPPLPTGSNYWAKWGFAFLHAAAANIDKVHVPNSPADKAAEAANGK